MKKIKILDIVIIGFSLLLIVLSVGFLLVNAGHGVFAKITTPSAEYLYNLEDDVRVTIKGELGNSVIVIDNEHAYFESSPCVNQLCVHCAPINSSAVFIACLPNKVFLKIESSKDEDTEEFDSIGY